MRQHDCRSRTIGDLAKKVACFGVALWLISIYGTYITSDPGQVKYIWASDTMTVKVNMLTFGPSFSTKTTTKQLEEI